jgi:hypothetical protein
MGRACSLDRSEEISFGVWLKAEVKKNTSDA